MYCIILAGGLGARLRPLTLTTPKALLEIGGKPIIEHTLEALPSEIKTVVIAVKHLGQKIKARVGKKYGARKVIYIDLVSLRGTMDALKQCKKYIKGKTLVLNGDDIYGREDLARLVKEAEVDEKTWHMLVKKDDTKNNNTAHIILRDNNIEEISEADEKQNKGDFLNTGAYILDERIFRYKPIKTAKGEYGLPQTMLSAKHEIPTLAVTASYWYSVNTKEDYEKIAHNIFFQV